MSSAVLAITERPAPSRSCIPAASFAPPVPPASTTQRSIVNAPPLRFRGLRESIPGIALGQIGDPDACGGLVADVDRDQHGSQGLNDAGHLERAGVDGAKSFDLVA